MTGTNNQKYISAVETTFEILRVLADIEPAGVSEITANLTLSTSSVFTHLNTLTQQGYLVKEGTTYRRSLQFLADGGVIRQRCEAPQMLEGKVDELATVTGEIAGAATEERGQRVILYRRTGEMGAGDKIPIGDHSYMHWTSLGKALLANLPPTKRTEIVDQHGLPSGTENTFTTREALGAELEQIRQQGYAVDNEEHLPGMRGIAVPILNSDQEVVASIGLTGPRTRFQSSYLLDLLDSLKYVKNEVEVRSQYYE